ncbi:MAG: glycosyltransferase, partial [Vicinamibacterales bacterium]
MIATHNRAAELRETLASLASLRPDGPWEVVVVDNNSSDNTRDVIAGAAAGFPSPLRYVFEKEQGRSPALNAGIKAADGDIIATTDDDVRVPQDWLNRAADGLRQHECGYVGGRVLPIWRAPRPAWLPNHGGKHWAVIALLDYGPEPLEFGARVPLGVNMAFRRGAFDRTGMFDPGTGRRAGTLLGQEVREWCIRARKAGVRGVYIPELTLEHIIPADRLSKRYFRRWFYWRGISRALLYQRSGLDMEAPEQTGLDFSTVPHVLGVPRYLYRKALRAAWAWLRETLGGRRTQAFEHELWLSFFAGIVRQCWLRETPGRKIAPGRQQAAREDKNAPEIDPIGATDVDATILICTYNRSAFLADTLDSLAQTPANPGFSWNVLIVDNNSTDDTRAVVRARIGRFPVGLDYLFEPRQGKSNALNAGMAAARAAIVVFTDDDVGVAPGWLREAVWPLLERSDLDYTGGPVRPVWGAVPPGWLNEKGNLGGTIAVKDHGGRPFIFEDHRKTPLGVNMAVRRRLIERIGGFRPDLGRNGRALLGQEQAEFFYRSREAGARGLYAPAMVLDHVVPASRLTRGYFRRWWYWKGVSHARVHRMHDRTELGIDLRRVPRVLGLPRFILGGAVRNGRGWISAWLNRDAASRAECWLAMIYAAGYCREVWRPTAVGIDNRGVVPARAGET